MARHRTNRIDWSFAALIALGSVLGACSADLSLNNLTLAPTQATAQKKPDWSSQTWGRSNFDRTVPVADLITPEGQCSGTGAEQANARSASAGEAQSLPLLGGIALRMTECEVVRRAGAIDKIDFGANERGERSVVLTYLRGPSPGIYRFVSGRLVSVEGAPSTAPATPPKAAKSAKKPAGT